MLKRKIKWLNIGIGCLVGGMVWFIWQAATAIPPELLSIVARVCMSKIMFGQASAADAFMHGAGEDLTKSTNPIVFLPVAMLASVVFSLLSPYKRLLLWFAVAAVYTFSALAFFEIKHLIIPYGGPLVLITFCYLCGTLIGLESEKISRSRELATEMQIQSEEERKRIAKDLHDEVLPSLSRVMRLADQLQEENAESTVPAEMRTRLESTVMEMRRVINDLHPAVLENLGLAPSLQHLVDRVAHETSIQAAFKDETKGISLPPFQSLCVYRIAQEALNNVEKHSEASHMVLALEKTQDTLLLSISDDGVGDVKMKADSHGLQNISHRAKLIGARVEWKAPDKFSTGTMLVLTVPIEDSVTDASQKIKEKA